MSELFMQLCSVSVVSGAILSLMPEGGSKKVFRILCTAALISCIVQPFLGFDFQAYAAESAKLHEMESAFIQNAAQAKDNLSRKVIHQQYREYILDKACELGLDELEAEIHTQWSEEGLWVPFSIQISGNWDEAQKLTLKKIISDELGIPDERQQWTRGQ